MAGTIGVKKRVRGGTAYGRPPYFQTKKLGIIGRTQSVVYAPWHDPSWTLATHCSAREMCEREPDWYFDMHRPECFRNEGKAWNDRYYTWLKRLQTPIFMQERWPEIPLAVRYPIERILQEFRAYFTNHAAYMIALAMTEGVHTIGLWGCQYGADTEYSTQRGSLEYWLGRFEQAGGQVIMPVKHNNVLAFPGSLYGYESHDAKGHLCGDYRVRAKVMKADARGVKVPTPLTPTHLTDGERANIPPLPNGDRPDWARYDELFGRHGAVP